MQLLKKGTVELAFQGVVLVISPTEPVYRGAESEEQVRPCTVVECFNLAEEPQGTGNYFADVRIRVKSPADKTADANGDLNDPAAEHNARVELILGGLKVDNLAELLRAAVPADFYVWDEVQDLGQDPEIDGRSFVDGHIYRIYCCGSVMA